MNTWGLSAEYTTRPAAMGDAENAVVLFNRCAQELTGERPHDAENQRIEWHTPEFDLDRDTRIVLDRHGTVVGYAEIWDLEEPHVRVHGWGRVDPDHRGRGIGSWLLRWQEDRAQCAVERAPDGARVTLGHGALSKDASTQALLRSFGFEPVRSFCRMVIEMDGPPPPAVWPDGVAVRAFEPDQDLERTVRSVRDAFSDHWGHVDSPFDEELKFWRHWITEEKDFDPTLWTLAMADGEVVGTCLGWPKRHEDDALGWIDVLGVVRPWRRRGLALALLRHAFCSFYARGKRKVGLGVDATSLTGANELYEKAGMRNVRESIAFEKELRPGRDLARRTLQEEGVGDGSG